MAKKPKDSQVVVRIDTQLERKIEASAQKKGLTKASWVRQVIIEKLDMVNVNT